MDMERNISSLMESGSHGLVVTVECGLSNSLPGIVIVGYAGRAVDEARERIRAAFAASKLNLPRKRITINLAPADIPKTGTAFDLAVAAAIMVAAGQVPATPANTAIMGELGLDGGVRPVRGIIGKILVGKQHGFRRYIIPAGNTAQAQLIPDVTLIPVTTLRNLYDFLSGSDTTRIDTVGTNTAAETQVVPSQSFNALSTLLASQVAPVPIIEPETTLDDIVGQELAKRAAAICAAGGHNLLLGGPPGTGKSMLAAALPSLLPPLSRDEMLEVTHLHSLASSNFDQIVTMRPFRAPHHSASTVSVIGGGSQVRPGEFSLGHHGVLLLDEFPEFARDTVEALRQPLETRTVTISRAKESVEYPARFILVATANPCPCGYYGTAKPCRCLPHEVIRYRRKLSGPILDRIDLYADMHEIDNSQLLTGRSVGADTAEIRDQITAARQHQAQRFGGAKKLNADMNNRDLKAHANLSPEAKVILDRAGSSLGLSARAYMRSLKVARTIADLDSSDAITTAHIAEALRYRPHSYHET